VVRHPPHRLRRGDVHRRGDALAPEKSLDTAKLKEDGWQDVGRGPGSAEGDFIDWLTIKNQSESVTSDVRRIRVHPFVPRSVAIYGYVYDVKNGRLIEVPEATSASHGGKDVA
jgi:carbonic anhydrase